VKHFKGTHEVIDIDGARVLFDGGWALIRASNTQPVIVARIEADSDERLREIADEIRAYLSAEGVTLPPVGSG
jgi:phosphomannomutase/phosphoglucomutase